MHIDFLLSREGREIIKEKIENGIKEAIHSPVISGRNLVFADIIFSYVENTLVADKELTPIEIKGLELRREWKFDGYRFKGFIDRLDKVGGRIRVVDYKTGRDDPKYIPVENASQVAAKLFERCKKDRPKSALQLFLYDMFVLSGPDAPDIDWLVNCMYSLPKMKTAGIVEARVNPEFCDLVKEKLRDLLAEISNPDIPFLRTEEANTCEYCDFKTICGR